MKHVLVVGGPDSTLDKLEALGVRYSMVQLPDLAGQRQIRGAVRYAVVDYRDPEEVSAVARAWHGLDPFDATVSFTEHGLEPASRIAADLGIAGDNLRAVLLTRDKTRTREVLDRHGLSPVRHRTCSSLAEAREFQGDLGGRPVVLKPVDGGLSEGVYVVPSPVELEQRWAWTRSATAGPVLAEEFLDGPEYSVETISLRGVHEVAMITEKVVTPPPRFVELGHQVPARLDAPVRSAVEHLVVRLLDLVGQTTGPAHTEIKLTAAGPRIIETQTRVGGDQVWELCEMVSGIDLMSEGVAGLLDLPAPPRRPTAGGAAIRFFGHEQVRVVDVQDDDAAVRAPGVVRATCTLRPGQELGPLLSSTARQGYVLCAGADTAEAVVRAETARDAVRVVTEPLR